MIGCHLVLLFHSSETVQTPVPIVSVICKYVLYIRFCEFCVFCTTSTVGPVLVSVFCVLLSIFYVLW